MNFNITFFIISKSKKWKRSYEFALISHNIQIPTTTMLSSMIITGIGLLDNGWKTIVQPQNKTIWIGTDKKTYIQYKIMIKSVVIFSEVKIYMTFCVLHKLCGKYNTFYKLKNITCFVITII